MYLLLCTSITTKLEAWNNRHLLSHSFRRSQHSLAGSLASCYHKAVVSCHWGYCLIWGSPLDGSVFKPHGCWQHSVFCGISDQGPECLTGCWLETMFSSLSRGPFQNDCLWPQRLQGKVLRSVRFLCNVIMEMTSPYICCIFLARSKSYPRRGDYLKYGYLENGMRTDTLELCLFITISKKNLGHKETNSQIWK